MTTQEHASVSERERTEEELIKLLSPYYGAISRASVAEIAKRIYAAGFRKLPVSEEARTYAKLMWLTEFAAKREARIADDIIERCAAVLDQRAVGYRARGDSIFSGKFMANELTENAVAIRALKVKS